MPWCPNCKTEYREGFSKCADCGADLVNELQDNKKRDAIPFNAPICPSLLISVANEIQAGLVENLLHESDIPYFIQDKGSGAYLKIYMGYSAFGTDIYVDQKNYHRAKEIVDAYLTQSLGDVAGEPSDDNDKRFLTVRRTVMKLIIVMAFLSFAVGLIFSLILPLFD